MFKTMFLLFVFGTANAATITITVDCNGHTTTVTSPSATCSMGLPDPSYAIAAFGSSPSTPFELDATAQAGTSFLDPTYSSASGHFSENFELTVTGGTGDGVLVAYVGLRMLYNQYGSFANGRLCMFNYGCYVTYPFTYGVPQQFSIWMDVAAAGGKWGAGASASAWLVLPGYSTSPSTYTIVEIPYQIPEPGSLSVFCLLLSGLAIKKVFADA